MSGVATAIGASALVGAVAARNSSKRAANTAEKTQDKQIAATDVGVQQARGDLFNLFPAAEANSQKGYQSALDVFGQFMPQQASTFQQGNMAAQNQILAGMPQQHNALMGGQVDYSQFQPSQVNYDPSMFQQQLPQYKSIDDAMNPLYGMTDEQIQNQTSMYPQQNTQQAGWTDIEAPTTILSGQGFLDFNKKVLESDPANRLAKKVASKDPVIKGLGKLFSDERLKENIKLVGEIAGQNLYTWNWRDTNVTRSFAGDAGIGFIAQEVEKNLPHAVTTDKSGYKKITLAEIFKESN